MTTEKNYLAQYNISRSHETGRLELRDLLARDGAKVLGTYASESGARRAARALRAVDEAEAALVGA